MSDARLFVGNLSYQTMENDLQEYFSQAGAVNSVNLMLDKFTGKSRVAIIGDSDFATNSFFHIMGNGKLFLNTVNYLASQENLIGIEARTYDLPRVNLTNRQMKGTFFLSLVLIPALMALVGIAVWWRQR